MRLAVLFGVLGLLVSSRIASGVGGASGWECTYQVFTRYVTVFETNVCAPTMCVSLPHRRVRTAGV